MAAPRKATAPAPEVEGVNFGDDSFYSGGSIIPEGDYILFFNVQMYQPQRKDGSNAGPSRLGCMVDFYPMDTPIEEKKLTKFYSMGSNADKSFAPNAAGKGLALIPGTSGAGLNDQTNWNLFRKSLMDSGLPQGIFTNDLSVLDGIHVHVANVPEPEERKAIRSQAATGEASGDQQQFRSSVIPIVTEIKDDGKPWEGTGGLPEAAPAKATAKAPVKTPVKAPAKTPAPAPVEEVSDDLSEIANTHITTVLTNNPNGLPKLKLRTETFAAAKKANQEAQGGQILDAYFGPGQEDALNAILGTLGYVLKGAMVTPA